MPIQINKYYNYDKKLTQEKILIKFYSIINNESLTEDQKLKQLSSSSHYKTLMQKAHVTEAFYKILSSVCMNGYVKILKFIYEQNNEVFNIIDKEGRTVLHFASFFGHIEMAEFILKAESKVIDTNLISSICAMGDIDKFQSLYEENKVFINMIDSEGRSFLHYAAYFGQVELAKYLLSIEPKLIDKVDNYGKSPLYYTTLEYKFKTSEGEDKEKLAQNKEEMAKFLLSINPSLSDIYPKLIVREPKLIDKLDKYGQSVLHFAASSVHPEMVKFLYSIKPSLVKIVQNEGKSALCVAASRSIVTIQDSEYLKNQLGVVEFLMSVNPEFPDHNKILFQTAQNHDVIFRTLTTYGADTSIENAEGEHLIQRTSGYLREICNELVPIHRILKPIITKFLKHSPLSPEERAYISFREPHSSQAENNIISSLVCLTKYEIRKALCAGQHEIALDLIDSILNIAPSKNFHKICFNDLDLYKIMIQRYQTIKYLEFSEILPPAIEIPAELSYKTSKLAKLENLKTESYKEIQSLIKKLNVEILGLDIIMVSKKTNELFNEIEGIYSKYTSLDSQIQYLHENHTEKLSGEDDEDSDDEEIEGGAEESKTGDFEPNSQDETDAFSTLLSPC